MPISAATNPTLYYGTTASSSVSTNSASQTASATGSSSTSSASTSTSSTTASSSGAVNYYSPINQYDSLAKIAVTVYRDSSSGETTSQVPPAQVVRQYERNGGESTGTQTPPSNPVAASGTGSSTAGNGYYGNAALGSLVSLGV